MIEYVFEFLQISVDVWSRHTGEVTGSNLTEKGAEIAAFSVRPGTLNIIQEETNSSSESHLREIFIED